MRCSRYKSFDPQARRFVTQPATRKLHDLTLTYGPRTASVVIDDRKIVTTCTLHYHHASIVGRAVDNDRQLMTINAVPSVVRPVDTFRTNITAVEVNQRTFQAMIAARWPTYRPTD
jgi:hypothetical protein